MVLLVLFLFDQSAQDDGRSVRRGNVGANITRSDCWDLIATDAYISAWHNTVDLLQNIERHFLLGINERHDLKLKHDFLVFDARLYGSRSVDPDSSNIRESIDRHRNLLP